jgi:hypothetical protein
MKCENTGGCSTIKWPASIRTNAESGFACIDASQSYCGMPPGVTKDNGGEIFDAAQKFNEANFCGDNGPSFIPDDKGQWPPTNFA